MTVAAGGGCGVAVTVDGIVVAGGIGVVEGMGVVIGLVGDVGVGKIFPSHACI